ncbi:hypothetical protein [Desulforamulus ruminis]|uniref:hypothetical protein n=1 Tax=Desulforamulus ruminis TaxID=1564 RepID=UPI0023544BFE|nr:hypothetical protein [Desulforamulus ruminis]
MIKECVFDSSGKLINIGLWDDQGSANPLPEGAYSENREVAYSPDSGWYLVGEPKMPTDKERLEALEEALLEVIVNG